MTLNPLTSNNQLVHQILHMSGGQFIQNVQRQQQRSPKINKKNQNKARGYNSAIILSYSQQRMQVQV